MNYFSLPTRHLLYPVPTTEALSVDERLPRGLSRNKICIGISCNDVGRSYFLREGFEKTSMVKTMTAFDTHIKKDSLLIHDKEKAHRKLVQQLGLIDEVHNAKILSSLEDKDNPLREVNRLCSLIKRFLDSHSGFNRDDLGGYLNLFSVIMYPTENKMKKVELVLNRAMTNPKNTPFSEALQRKAQII